ncbi:MAG: hypothetical protein M3M87_06490, partial [Thermoproteota archaeon]|nr:hypothetical protein [Thermoproteota archaeon]
VYDRIARATKPIASNIPKSIKGGQKSCYPEAIKLQKAAICYFPSKRDIVAAYTVIAAICCLFFTTIFLSIGNIPFGQVAHNKSDEI